MQLRRCGQLLAQIGRRVDEKPVVAVGADRDRRLGACQSGIAARLPANRTAAIPLRNPATGCGAQDDDAKHGSSPGIQTSSRQTPELTQSRDQERVTSGARFRSKGPATPAAYLRAAHAYMLISMPTGT